MAHKTSASSDGSLVDFFQGIGRSLFQGASHFWNINKDVGWGYTNKKDDVLLIQFLINSVNRAVGGGQQLVEDGIFGKKTCKGIKTFQQFYNSRCGTNLFVDGAVNIPPGLSSITISPWSGKIVTIHALNSLYSNYHRPYYDDIKTDPKLPINLRQFLMV